MSTTLTELLQPRSQATIEAILMATLQSASIEGMPGVGFPVTDWLPGSFERTHMKMIAAGLADREDMIRMLTAGGFLELAATLVDADGNTIDGWMELLAAQTYLLNRTPAGYTRQVLTMTCTAGPGPYTRGPGEIIAYAPATGNRYLNVSAITIPDGGSVTGIFQAEGPGVAYLDSAGSIVALITPMPGVSVTNAATAAGIPAEYLSGSGAIDVTSTGITTTFRTVKLTFTQSGRIDDDSARFTCTVYQGSGVTTTGPYTAAETFTQGDLSLSLTDGAAGTQSFNAGDEWIVGVPGTPILQAGTDQETLQALAQRCRDRWPSLSDIPTGNRYQGLVRECEASQHLGVTKVKTRPSSTVAGVEDIFVAGATASATPAQVAAVQAYIDPRSGMIDAANVVAAQALDIVLAGSVKCRRGTTAAVKVAADQAWIRYIARVDIGGEDPEGLIKLIELENALHDAGCYTIFGLTLNGSAADVSLSAYQCAAIAADPNGLPSLALTWLEVA
jgi:hypothetical protein